MRKQSLLSFLGMAMTLLHAAGVQGGKHRFQVDADDRKLIAVTPAFGFGSIGATLNLTIRDVLVNMSTKADLSKIGFVMIPFKAETILRSGALTAEKCILDILSKKSSPSALFTFDHPDVRKLINQRGANESMYKGVSLRRTKPSWERQYLYFANCLDNVSVSFTSDINMYKMDGYLQPVGEKEAAQWVAFGLFALLCAVWGWSVWRARRHARPIHYLMGLLCALEALTALTQAAWYHSLEQSGQAHGWIKAWRVVTVFHSVLFYPVVVLIGAGWSHMKPRLSDKETTVLVLVAAIGALSTVIAFIAGDQNRWSTLYNLTDAGCCYLSLRPVNWSLERLTEAAAADDNGPNNEEDVDASHEAPTDSMTEEHTDTRYAEPTDPTNADHIDGRSAEQFVLLTKFNSMVFYYRPVMAVTRFVLVYATRFVPTYQWVFHVACQLPTMAMYVWTAYHFGPHGAGYNRAAPAVERGISAGSQTTDNAAATLTADHLKEE